MTSKCLVSGAEYALHWQDAPATAKSYREERLAAGEIDQDGNELGDYCVWCARWFAYEISLGPYCDDPMCQLSAERD